ncbi:MAG: hypothetical protein J0M12_03815 [Deltaproteobacteria bacterium]|nr:hypothetical protein [Deltaproteobacteria bacterium]
MRLALLVFFTSFFVYVVANVAAVRSPDGEIQFRTAESLAFHQRWNVTEDLQVWPGFGLARGIDGERYSIFGPLQPLLLSPMIHLAEPLSQRIAADDAIKLPASHYVGVFGDSLQGKISGPRLPHARRFVASFEGPFFGALCVTAFFLTLLVLAASAQAALFGAAVLAFATPLWSYSGTDFSEVPALAFLLWSFYFLMRARGTQTSTAPLFMLEASGLLFGLACAAHISTLLWFPFFLVLVSPRINAVRELFRKSSLQGMTAFLLGAVPALSTVAVYNYQRFGNIFETGRYVRLETAKLYGYGFFTVPIESLYGLLFSGGKGIFIFVPIVLWALVSWRYFSRALPWVAKVILVGITVRYFVIASRTDWHGGFALGPRYLLLVVPFLLLPLAFVWQSGRFRTLSFGILGLCMLEQAYFCCGEIFSFYHAQLASNGLDVFSDDRLYLDWTFSPLLGLWRLTPAPFLLQVAGLGFGQALTLLWLLAVLCSLGWLKMAGNVPVKSMG